MTRQPGARLVHVGPGQLSYDTAQTPGMRRAAAISRGLAGSERLWMGENRMAPASRSGNHHHGASETGIYVVSGRPIFVCLEQGKEVRVEAGPGDYIYVPAFLPHREENPAPEDEAVVVLARTTQEAVVVNLESLAGD